jgi:ubiquinone/menaquinone biosynthesis C-methylase UbiE
MSTLNARELAMMDSPLRRLSQRLVEFRTFRRLLARAGIELAGAGAILDAGCGNGHGLELIANAFHPLRLVGFDLMPEQIERARRRVGAELAIGDIAQIAHPDNTFDAVFVFGILHHVPKWRTALRELARVLKPGGALCVEELHGDFIRWQDRLVGTSHPREAAFDWPAFRSGLADAGLAIRAETGLPFARSFVAVRR